MVLIKVSFNEKEFKNHFCFAMFKEGKAVHELHYPNHLTHLGSLLLYHQPQHQPSKRLSWLVPHFTSPVSFTIQIVSVLFS